MHLCKTRMLLFKLVNKYCITTNFGKELSLLNWWIVTKSPNLNFANIILYHITCDNAVKTFVDIGFTIASIRRLLFVLQSKPFVMVSTPPSVHPHTASNTFKHWNNTCQYMQWLIISTRQTFQHKMVQSSLCKLKFITTCI